MGVCGSNIKSNSPVYYLQIGDTKGLIGVLMTNKDYISLSKSVNEFNDTILHYAAAVGNEEAVEWICRQGIDINIQNTDNCTALDVAIMYKHHNIVEYLRSRGCYSVSEYPKTIDQ